MGAIIKPAFVTKSNALHELEEGEERSRAATTLLLVGRLMKESKDFIDERPELTGSDLIHITLQAAVSFAGNVAARNISLFDPKKQDEIRADVVRGFIAVIQDARATK